MLALEAKLNTTEVTLRARNNSLQVIYTSVDQSVDQCVNQTSTPNPSTTECPSTTTVSGPTVVQIIEIGYKSSGPLITGLWIGFIFLGLLIGTVGGFFASKRFIQK